MGQYEEQLNELLSKTVVLRCIFFNGYRGYGLELDRDDYAFVSNANALQVLYEHPDKLKRIKNLTHEEKKELFSKINKSRQVDTDTKQQFPLLFESRRKRKIREEINEAIQDFQPHDTFEYWDDFRWVRIVGEKDIELNENQRQIIKYIVITYGYELSFKGSDVIKKVAPKEESFFEAFKSNPKVRTKLFELISKPKGHYQLVLKPKITKSKLS